LFWHDQWWRAPRLGLDELDHGFQIGIPHRQILSVGQRLGLLSNPSNESVMTTSEEFWPCPDLVDRRHVIV